MKIEEVKDLVHLLDQTSLSELELEQNGAKLSLKKTSDAVVQTTTQPVVSPEPQQVGHTAEQTTKVASSEERTSEPSDEKAQHTVEVVSPMVGTFYNSPSPDADVYVKVGDKVNDNSIVCIVEAMKLFNEIEADQSGEVVEILVENGELVEYGQPLFLLKKEA